MNAALRSIAGRTPVVRQAALWIRSINRSIASAGPGVYTLCYHKTEQAAQAGLQEQLSFFMRHGTFLSATAAVQLLASSAPIAERYFVLSFDDGYANNVSMALPILRTLKIPALMFLVSDWIQSLEDSRYDPTYVTDAQVRTWLSCGMEIGSHSATHRGLMNLSAMEVREELTRSRLRLSELSGRAIKHFACPWGVANRDFDPRREPEIAAECGYDTFFTTRRGHATVADDLLLMPRHVVEPNWGLYELEALIGDHAIERRG